MYEQQHFILEGECATTPGQQNSSTMCYKEDVFHIQCGHWGRRRFSGEPCIRSRVVKGNHTGCSYVDIIGMANSDQLCSLCARTGTVSRPKLPPHSVSSPAVVQRRFSLEAASMVAPSKCVEPQCPAPEPTVVQGVPAHEPPVFEYRRRFSIHSKLEMSKNNFELQMLIVLARHLEKFPHQNQKRICKICIIQHI